MKAYVINMKRSVERRMYMEGQLQAIEGLDAEFVEAVDGRLLTAEERGQSFDDKRFEKRNANVARPGEVGCTLSHQKCYRKMVDENEPCVLILEDDIQVTRKIEGVLKEIEPLLKNDDPIIVLLSGWYWYLRTSSLAGCYKLANVYDAFLTHAYVINRAAARLMIEERPCITADDWGYIRRKGVKLKAVLPHVVDQNWSGELMTTVNVESNKRKSICWYAKNFLRLLTMKILLFCGHFERA